MTDLQNPLLQDKRLTPDDLYHLRRHVKYMCAYEFEEQVKAVICQREEEQRND